MTPLSLQDEGVSWKGICNFVLFLCPLSITSELLHCLPILIWKIQLLWREVGSAGGSEDALQDKACSLGVKVGSTAKRSPQAMGH